MNVLFFRNRGFHFPFAGFLFGLCCLVVLSISGPVFAEEVKTLYVDADATGANDGSSWAGAYKSLAVALDVASADSGNEIWAAEGTYHPEYDMVGNGSPADARTKTFNLKSGVALYGGFSGTENFRDERDPAQYVTVLTGDIGDNDVVSIDGTVSGNEDNSYHVVLSHRMDSAAIVDGFTVTGGNANGTDPDKCSGGGMWNLSSSPAVTNCTFSGNNSATDGGGMHNYGSSSPAVTNCTFSENSAEESGGGMHNYEHSSPAVTNCTFSGNSATGGGGGMHNYRDSSPTVTNCTFSGNSAAGGGGMYNYWDSSPTVTNCTFSGNSVRYSGGGMYSFRDSSPAVTNSTFSGNSAEESGGGMYNPPDPDYSNQTSSPTVTNCIFWGDTGGEISNEGVNLTLTYCVVQSGDVLGTYDSGDIPLIIGDPFLGPLADNGGPTRTCALGVGSSAIDAGAASGAPATDQRGVTRPYPSGGAFDIGAYEVAPFTVTVSADLGGTVSVEPYGIIISGDLTAASRDFMVRETPAFVITSEESMDLTGVWLDGAEQTFDATGATVTLEPLRADHKLAVTFAVKTFDITGTVWGDVHGSVTATPPIVDWGKTSEVAVSADNSYYIFCVTVDGATADITEGAKTWNYTFDNVSADHEVEAAFAADRYTLTATTDGTGRGDVTVSPDHGTYAYGAEVALRATPAESSNFTGWSGALSGGANPATVTMDADKSVTANFALKAFNIAHTAGTGGTVSPSGITSVTWDRDLIVTITPHHGYSVSDVVVDGISRGALNSYIFYNVQEAGHTLHATFAADQTVLEQGDLEALDFPGSGGAMEALIGGTASVDFPAGLTGDSFVPVASSDLGGFWLEAFNLSEAGTQLADAEPGCEFLCGVSFDVAASSEPGKVGFLAVDLELVVPEDMLSTNCLEAIANDEAEAGLTEAFLTHVSILKVLSDDVSDLFGVALDSGTDPLDFFVLSRNEAGSFLVRLGLIIADSPAVDVAAVQAVPASGDCRFLVFDGAADGHYRDPLVAVERDSGGSGSGGGCNALSIPGLALLMLPLLGLLKK